MTKYKRTRIVLLIAVFLGLLTWFLMPEVSVSPKDNTIDIGFATAEAGILEYDYVCDGIDDDVQVQQALDALPADGGCLRLWNDFSGTNTYHFGATVTRAIHDVMIVGMGNATKISYDGVNPCFAAGGNNWLFKNISVDAGGVNLGAGSDCYRIEMWIANVWTHDLGGGAIALDDLTDVVIAGLAEGHFIRYNSGAGEWQNTLLSAGDIPASIATDAELAAVISDAAYGAGWDGVTTIAPSKNAVYDKMQTLLSAEADTLNTVYERGSSVTCDVADVLWTLNAAGVDFIVNMANTGDIIIQDNGTAVHTWDDAGLYTQTVRASVPELMAIDGTWTGTTGTKSCWSLNPTHNAGTITVSGTTWNVYDFKATDATAMSSGYPYLNVYDGLFRTYMTGTFSGSSNPSVVAVGLYGGAYGYNSITTSGGVYRFFAGLQFAASIVSGTVNQTGTTYDQLYAISVTSSATGLTTTTPATYTAELRGLDITCTGAAAKGTQTAYGIYTALSGADTHYGAWFTIPDNAQTGIAIQVNAAQASADGTLMDFRSTTGSEGTIALAAGGVVTYNAFTGSHYTQIQGDVKGLTVGTVLEIIEGEVDFPTKYATVSVSAKDESGQVVLDDKQLAVKELATVSVGASPDKEQLFLTRICQTEGSQSAVGVYGGRDGMDRDFCWGLGTGMIWVANQGKDLAIGDYLMSSNVRGCAELQVDDVYRSVTIAKATEVVKWNIGEMKRLVKCILLGG